MPTSIRHGANDLRIPHIFANTSCRLPSCQDYASAYRWEQLCSLDLPVATVAGLVEEFVAIGFGSVAAFVAIAVEVEIHIRILGRILRQH